MQIKYLPNSLYTLAKHSNRMALYADHPEVEKRIEILEKFERLTQDESIPVRRAAGYVDASLATIYRWRDNFRKKGLGGLMNGSRRPHRCRHRQWSDDHLEEIIKLREQYPYWGKAKIHCLLKRVGIHLSVSTVGRMISELIRCNRIVRCIYVKKKRQAAHKRPWAKRGWGGLPTQPGEVIQVDTMTVSREGCVIKQFTATDVASRLTLGQLYSRATAFCGRRFLKYMIAKAPFTIENIQVDGGSEFKAEFEEHCADVEIPLIVLPPRSPQLNTRVEYMHGTCRREFWGHVEQVVDFNVSRLQPLWQKWLKIYNTIRPHQGISMMTPCEYIRHFRQEQAALQT